jgi:hypothetical protein
MIDSRINEIMLNQMEECKLSEVKFLAYINKHIRKNRHIKRKISILKIII